MTIPDEAVQAAQNEFNKFGYTAPNEKELIAAITAALPFLQGVKVKALEWPKKLEFNHVLEAGVARYRLINSYDDVYRCSVVPYDDDAADLCGNTTLEGAKAAAQSDYEARIRSAIELLGNSEQLNDVHTTHTLSEQTTDMGNPITLDIGKPITDKTTQMVIAEAIENVWWQTRDCDVEEIDSIIDHLRNNGLLVVGSQRFQQMADAIQQASAYLALTQPNSAEKLLADLDAALKPVAGIPVSSPSLRAQALEEGKQLYGPFGHLTGDRNLSEDTWEVYDEPAATVGDIFSIPLYALSDPFKEIGLDVDVKADVLSPDPAQYLEMAVQVADKANKGWLKKRDVTANKKEASDYETMAIAASHISTAIRALSSQSVADEGKGEWREIEYNHALKGRRVNPAYFPSTGEVCEISGPNCDDDKGYTWGETTVLWQNEMFVLYGKDGYWPVLHKHEHVLFRPLPDSPGASE